MKSNNSSAIFKAYQNNYEQRSNELKEKFSTLMSNSDNKEYAFNTFRQTYSNPNETWDKSCQDLNQKIIHERKLNSEHSHDSLLKKFIDEENIDLKFIEKFGVYMAIYDFENYLAIYKIKNLPEEDLGDENISHKNNSKISKRTEVKFTNLSQRDFVKIIYAFHFAGIINNGKGEVTKEVEEIARRFDFDLGEGWQANFSKGVNYANNGHSNDEILELLQKSYSNYKNSLLEKQAKATNKKNI